MAVQGKKETTTISSSMSKASGEDFDVYCQPCDRDDARVLATGYCVDCEEHLCDSCLNHHKKAKPSVHHKLLDKQNMPSVQKPSTTPVPLGQSLTKPCPKHSQEFIKLYCHNHNALLCSICVTLQHTGTSCHVDYIPDISGQIVDSKEYTDTIKAMDALSEKCQKITGALKVMVTKSNGSLTDVIAEIKKFRKEINEKLDLLEKDAEDAAKALKQENDSKLTAAEMICDEVTKQLKASSDSMKLLNTSKQADILFMELQSANNLLTDDKKCVSELESTDVNDCHFEPNQALAALFEKEKPLGRITEKKIPSPCRIIDSWKPTYHEEIGVKTLKDKKNCSITEMVLLNPKKLVLTDHENNSVKMVDTDSKSVTDQLNLGCFPSGVTSVNSEQVAVAMPFKKLIQFISVSSDKLIALHTLKVSGECDGIFHYKGKLLVSYTGKLQILDMQGNKLTKFKTNSSVNNLVIANNDYIYLPDRKQSSVIMYNWQGDLIGSHGGMGSPRGLAMLADGSFLVSDYRNDMCNIKHVSADCTNSTVVLKDMCSNPYSICWCAATSTLYVSNYSVKENYSNFIHVFKMS